MPTTLMWEKKKKNWGGGKHFLISKTIVHLLNFVWLMCDDDQFVKYQYYLEWTSKHACEESAHFRKYQYIIQSGLVNLCLRAKCF